jgi:protein-S-isoprenylcysteine O-methyltransferase Ste14
MFGAECDFLPLPVEPQKGERSTVVARREAGRKRDCVALVIVFEGVSEMDFVPDFEIGLWNAWIIIVASLLSAFVPLMLGGETVEARMERDPEEWNGRARLGVGITHAVLMPATLIYSLFVPLETGTWWLYSGLAVSIVGIGLSASASILFAGAPLDAPMTSGAYAVSRHPMYVGTSLVYLGVGIAGTSWIFLVCAALNILGYALVVPAEEDAMLAKFGCDYQVYAQRTARWLGWPKSQPEHAMTSTA